MLDDVLIVQLLDMMLNPVLESLTKSCVDDVGYPLPRQQVELLLVRQVAHQLGVLLGLREHALHGDILVLRAVDLSVVVRLDAYSC